MSIILTRYVFFSSLTSLASYISTKKFHLAKRVSKLSTYTSIFYRYPTPIYHEYVCPQIIREIKWNLLIFDFRIPEISRCQNSTIRPRIWYFHVSMHTYLNLYSQNSKSLFCLSGTKKNEDSWSDFTSLWFLKNREKFRVLKLLFFLSYW